MNITVFRVYQLNLLTAISMYMKSLFYLFLSIVRGEKRCVSKFGRSENI